ncbi:WbqC family protein [Paenibacillus sp. N1-5-1-14]|uniref:WbqC family protein n=1 Tax=Paenibacillus radicibacter TaxID=2972488 RepID=UPI0021593567|nr:WbqC family protein [Paenibacillus radicibacter]MCR8641092.1 WbqC family protein [Paenibacillus radicibacter]
MIVAVHQPNYIPWIGFFDKMDQVDQFVILDMVQHSKMSVTHRNSIKSPSGSLLLSVPLKNKGMPIHELQIRNDEDWLAKHWKSITYNYSRSKHWEMYAPFFQQIYESTWTSLSDLNMSLILLIRDILHIETAIVYESELKAESGLGSTRIVNICSHLGAMIYLSGNGARSYNNELEFRERSIKLVYQQFNHPVYAQQWGAFISHLSIIDMIFNHGPQSIEIIRAARKLDIRSEALYG